MIVINLNDRLYPYKTVELLYISILVEFESAFERLSKYYTSTKSYNFSAERFT